MATEDPIVDELDAAPPPGRWDFLFSWTGLFLFGWVLYELTSQAFLGVTIFCFKLGWEDFRTAVWLRSKDPVAVRGKMELWIFIASGLWRTAIAAFIIMMLIALVSARLGAPAPDELTEAGMTALVGFTVSAITTMRALGLAVWSRRKLWLHPSMHEMRKQNRWPPIPLTPANGGRMDVHGKNKAGTLIVFSVTAFSFLLLLLSFALLGGLMPVDARVILVTLFIFFGYPVMILWLRDQQRRHLLAQSPEECWSAQDIIEE